MSAPTVAIAMSGGVDSSVAAILLKEQGYRVIGLTMDLGIAAAPGKDAAAIAAQLDIPLVVLPYQQLFEQTVIHPFTAEYRDGVTPNPCVACNRLMKFGVLAKQAFAEGATYFATGHYARIIKSPGSAASLAVAANRAKDQSYFLYGIEADLLDRIIFPLGDIADKQSVREIARKRGLAVADKQDSQEICFVPNDDYAGFLEKRCPELQVPGEIRHISGQRLGYHRGTYRYTVGQRKGLGIAWHEPLYVLEIIPKTRTVIVGERSYLFCRGLTATACNWLAPLPDTPLLAKVRYRHHGVSSSVIISNNGSTMDLHFSEPQAGIAPGQSVVLYHEDRVLGGGIISTGIPVSPRDAEAPAD